MNIFFLDHNPIIAAQYLHDVHLRKMIVETAQLLCTNAQECSFHKCDTTKLYKKTHVNHPMSIWTRDSIINYSWLLTYLYGLLVEYKFRFDKTHKTTEIYEYLITIIEPIYGEISQPPLCMPDQYKIDDYIGSYRTYYRKAKQFDKNGKFIGKYTKRNMPEFLQ